MTQRNIIIKYLQSREDWIKGYELEKLQTSWGWLGNQGMRRARELAEEGVIEVRRNGKYVEYRAYPVKVQKVVYIDKNTVAII